MESIEQYLGALKRSSSILKQLDNTLDEDKQNIHRGLSGDAEEIYKKQCDKVISKIKKIEKQIQVLYSESSAGL